MTNIEKLQAIKEHLNSIVGLLESVDVETLKHENGRAKIDTINQANHIQWSNICGLLYVELKELPKA